MKLFKIGHRSENYYNDSEENTNTNTNSDYSNNGSYEGPEIGSRNSYCRVGSNAVFPSYNSGPKSTDLKLPVNMNARNKSDAQQVYATNKRGFENAHVYNINSISIHSDGETFLSADDLRINTWNVERNSCCYSK